MVTIQNWNTKTKANLWFYDRQVAVQYDTPSHVQFWPNEVDEALGTVTQKSEEEEEEKYRL